MSDLKILGGLIGKNMGLECAAVASIALDSYTKGKSVEVKFSDLAAATSMDSDEIIAALGQLQADGHVQADFEASEVSSFYVSRIVLVLSPGQYAMNGTLKDPKKARVQTGEDTFKVYGTDYLAVVEKDMEGFSLQITRKDDDKMVVDQHFDTREAAWAWADEWATQPVRLDAPDKPGRWTRYYMMEGPGGPGDDSVEGRQVMIVTDTEEGGLWAHPEAEPDTPKKPVYEFEFSEWALIPEPEPEPLLDAPTGPGRWVRVAGGFEIPTIVELLDGELCAPAEEGGACISVAELPGQWKPAQIEEEAEQADPEEAAEGAPKKRRKAKDPAPTPESQTFTVSIDFAGGCSEIHVEHTPCFLKGGPKIGPSQDRFWFEPEAAFSVDAWEELVPNADVPSGQAVYEFARALAQRHVDGGNA